MTGGVEDDEVASRHGPQHAEHGVEVELAVGTQVRVGPDGQAGGFEDLGMVGPGGRREPCGRARAQRVHEVGRHPQGAGAPRRVEERDAPGSDGRMVGAEDEVAHRPEIRGIAVDGLVDLRGLLRQEPCLGLAHRRQDRGGARLIDVHPRRE